MRIYISLRRHKCTVTAFFVFADLLHLEYFYRRSLFCFQFDKNYNNRLHQKKMTAVKNVDHMAQ